MTKQFFIYLSNNKKYPYQLRLSNRAKQISMRLSAQGELNLVLPIGMKESLAHEFAQKQSKWLEKQLNKEKNNHKKITINTKPDILNLKMLNEQWSVKYVEGEKNQIEYNELADKCLQIRGEINSDQLVQKIIGLFLKNKASHIFPDCIKQIASLYKFDFDRVKIRGQKGRWGSCSSRKIINLNYKLLFMPERVARYVFIHELCHTIEMNHSAKFWQLVESCDPNYKEHEVYLKEHGGIIRYF